MNTTLKTLKSKQAQDQYNKVLETNGVIHRSFNSIRSKNHKIDRINTTKVSFNSYDNKRYWTNSIDSLAYGHFGINDLTWLKEKHGIYIKLIYINVY